jgi:uncharacterized membrane protein YozB (DUF420 family)
MYSSGFLTANSPFGADLNLVVQIGVALLLLAGAGLARLGWYRAHGACQASAFAAMLVLTIVWMIPQLRSGFGPALVHEGATPVNLAVAAHITLGSGVLVLGAWVILVAATNVVPPRLRFKSYKLWMRTLLGLWWATVLLGLATYRFAWMTS